MRKYLTAFVAFPCVVLIIALAALPAAVRAAVIVFPPADSRMFIAVYETSSPHQTCLNSQCTIVSSTGPSLTLPTVTFGSGATFETASGTVNGLGMSGSMVGSVATSMYLAMNDTYLLSGSATGLVPMTITFSATGVASSVASILVGSTISLTIGTFAIQPDPNGGIPLVAPFAQTSQARVAGPTIGPPGGSAPLAVSLVYTHMVPVNQPFDIAYQTLIGAARGGVDLLGATISIAVPTGLTLSSALTSAVPEPHALALWGVGLLGLPWLARRRRTAPR